MRVHIYYRYFWPDTPPYAVMLKDITAWLVQAGFSVKIGTAQPAYKPEARIPRQPWEERVDGVEIRRFRLLTERTRGVTRVLNGGLFVARAALSVLFGSRPDVVMTATMPPVLQALCLLVCAKLRGASFVYHMQDIYPEIAEVQSGKGSLLKSALRIIDNWTLRKSDAVVVLSEDMRRTINTRIGRTDQCHIINNFSLIPGGQQGRGLVDEKRPIRFLFAGNLGRFQNLEKLIDAFSLVDPSDAEICFLGDGVVRAKLEEMAKAQSLPHVSFHGHVPPEVAFAKMRESDVGIVSLMPGLIAYAFPSKVLTYLAAGLPIFALVERKSALGQMLEDGQLGECVDPEASVADTAKGLQNLVHKLRKRKFFEMADPSLYHPDFRRVEWVALMRQFETARGKTS